MKRLIIAIILILAPFGAYAQTSVSGIVKDTKGEPVVGAVVLEKGTNNGTMTAADGSFSIAVSNARAVLDFSCMGYASREVTIGKDRVLNVELEEDSKLLDEVVVVGYGAMRKSDLTGAVSSVKIDEDLASKSMSLDQMLQGRATGIEVINASEAPDAGVSVRIRGITSLNGSCDPLYVVDGVIMTNSGTSDVGPDASEEVNGLMGINPQDIESIEVLKDASATAIFGASGANGVVLITTKGAKKDKPVIKFNVGVDINEPYSRIKTLNFDEYMEYLEWRRVAGDTQYASATRKEIYRDYGTPEQKILGVPMDWQKEYIRNSTRQRYYLSISGRPKTLSYQISFGYTKSDGIVANTDNEQYTARVNIEKQFGQRFKIGTRTGLAFINSHMMQGAGTGDMSVSSSFLKSLLMYRPFMRIYDTDSETYEEDSEGTYRSPSRWITQTYKKRKDFRATPSIYAQYSFIPKVLYFKMSFGADYHRDERSTYKGSAVTIGPSVGGYTYGDTYNMNWDNTLNFTKKFGRHNLNATLGFTMNRYHTSTQYTYAKEIVQDGMQGENLNSASNYEMTYGESQSSKMSGFARAVYNYSDRYVVTATYRVDGSSRFASGNRFAGFPSVAAAWRINSEPWFDSAAISMLKLRLGWGMVGNCSVSPYQIMSTYGSSKLGMHFNEAEYTTAVRPNVFANRELKWETTKQLNGGLDFSMWKGRLALTVDAYYKNTYDLLQNRTVTYNTGYGSIWVNQGSIENKGLEISLEATPVATPAVEWTLNANISFNRNRLTDIGFDVEEAPFYFEPGVEQKRYYYGGASIATSQHLQQQPINLFMLGEPIGLFYGYRTDGLVKEGTCGIPTSQENYAAGIYSLPGTLNYVDMNGNGYLDTYDRTVIGNANPKFTFGFNTSLSIKKFTLSASFNGSYGNQIFNATKCVLTDTHKQSLVQNIRSDAWYNAWTVINPYTTMRVTKDASLYGIDFYQVYSTNEIKNVTDIDVEDGSYLRLASLALSYTFDLPKQSPLSKIVIGASVSNLFMLTRYSGYSPIVNSFALSSKRIGIDSGGYPTARSYCFDLKLTF